MRRLLKSLNDERGETLKRMDALLNGVDSASGALSIEQEKEWSDMEAKVKTLDFQIEAENKMHALKLQQPTVPDICSPISFPVSDSPRGSGSAEQGGPERWRDINSGKEIFALGPQHKLTDYSANRGGFSGISNQLKGSLGRLVRAKILGSWNHAEFEHEISALGGSTDNSSGGWLIPEILSNIVVDLARAKSVCVAAGAVTLPLDGETRIARIISDPTIQCKAENDQFTDSGPTFDSILLSPWTIGAYTILSRELVQDSVNGPETIENALVAALSTALDLYCLAGTGVGQPMGLIYSAMAALNKIPDVGSPSYDDILDAIAAIETDNETPSSWILSPATNCTLAKLLINTEPNHYSVPPSDIASLSKFVTTSCPDTYAAVGDFRQMLIGIRQDMQVEVSSQESERFSRHQLGIKCVLRADTNLSRAGAFAVLSGITA